MHAILEQIGPANALAGAAVILGLVVVALAVRAATNAALALKTRVLALGSGAALLGVGAGRPLGLDQAIPEALTQWFSATFDTPLEQASVIAVGVVALGMLIGLVLVYFWIRAMIRLAWMAFVGLALLAVSLAVVRAAEGIVPVPDVLRDGFVLTGIVAMLLVVWGIYRMVTRPAPPPSRA